MLYYVVVEQYNKFRRDQIYRVPTPNEYINIDGEPRKYGY